MVSLKRILDLFQFTKMLDFTVYTTPMIVSPKLKKIQERPSLIAGNIIELLVLSVICIHLDTAFIMNQFYQFMQDLSYIFNVLLSTFHVILKELMV